MKIVNMKKIVAILGSVFMLSVIFAQGIEFSELSFEKALKEAEKTGKLIFVDAYATWCGPCKLMSRDVFTEESVGNFYSDNFINLKIDQEKGEGISFAKEYDVRFFPTLLFITGKGEIAHKAVGSMDPQEFIQLGKNALNKKTQLLSLQNKRSNGTLSPELQKNYAEALLSAMLPEAETAAFEYLKTVENWKEDEQIEFIFRHFPSSAESEVFSFVLEERALFDRVIQNPSLLDQKISRTIAQSIEEAGYTSDTKIAELFKTYYPNTWQQEAERYHLSVFERNLDPENLDEYYKRKVEYLKKYGSDSWQELNSVAWEIYEQYDDQDLLKSAQRFAKQSMEIETNYYNADTYTWISVKLGDRDSALKYALKAYKLGLEEEANVSELENLIGTLR